MVARADARSAVTGALRTAQALSRWSEGRLNPPLTKGGARRCKKKQKKAKKSKKKQKKWRLR